MFGIGGGELMFLILIVLMLFGSDKIPEIARMLGKGMRQLKDATNDIKGEISKGAEEHGFDKSLVDIRGNINAEIEKAKENLIGDTTAELNKTKEEIDSIGSGPIKRQQFAPDTTTELNKAKDEIESIVSEPIKRQQ